MADETEIVRVRHRLLRGTAAEMAAANPVLLAGEPGVETDTGVALFGDGSTEYNSLPRPHPHKADLPRNVRDFGAKCDGAADDSAAVQAALNAGPGIVEILNGTAKITAPLFVGTSGVSLHLGPAAVVDGSGLPTDAVLLKFGGSIAGMTTATGNIAMHATQVPVVSTAGFAVGDLIRLKSDQPWDLSRGAGAYTFSEWHRVASVSSNVLGLAQRVAYAWDHTTYPITVERIAAVQKVGVTGGTLMLGGTGSNHKAVEAQYFDGVNVADVTIRNGEDNGVRLSRGVNAIVSGCIISGSDHAVTGYGVIAGGCEGVVIADNIGFGNRRSFEVNGSSYGISRNIIISNNIARHDRTTGIGTHAGTDYVMITDNLIDGCGGGIISRGPHVEISGNVIRDSVEVGAGSYLDGITVGAVNTGLGGVSSPAEIGGATGGLGVRITNNIIEGSARSGVLVRDVEIQDMLISGNRMQGCTEGGITISREGTSLVATNLAIHDNIIDGAHKAGRVTHGIAIRMLMRSVTILRNQIRYTNTSSMWLRSGATAIDPNVDVVIADNLVSDCLSHGIDIAAGYWDRFTGHGNRGQAIVGDPFRWFGQDSRHLTRPVVYGNHSWGTDVTQGPVAARAAVPSGGTWRVGDIVWNTAPTAGGTVGWVCVTAGTPGTWKTFGAIAA